MNPQTDEELDRLANYFIRQKIADKRGWTFAHFVDVYLRGGWEA